MSISYQLKVDLKDSFTLADKTAHDQKTKAWWLGKLFITKEKRNYLFLCYAYLRWVDNFIDDKNNAIVEKRRLIKKQEQLLASILSGNTADIQFVEEHFLYYLIQYALAIGNTSLANELLNMIKTFEMDIQRIENNGIFKQQELDRYAKGQANALFGILFSFFPTQKYDSKPVALASLHHFYLLRDFIEDLEMGYINISTEELQKFKLNETNLADVGRLTEWVAHKISFIEKLINDEIIIVKDMPLKFRFLLFGLFPYLYIKIKRIKTYGYNIEESVNKKFLVELKIFFSAVVYDFKVLAKIFF
jgi:phytoene/squalene synthetase